MTAPDQVETPQPDLMARKMLVEPKEYAILTKKARIIDLVELIQKATSEINSLKEELNQMQQPDK